jgi:tetratricopeptide (TPR) repeat protein
MVWWSFMLDCQLFGLNAGWHHLMNLAFHLANALLLFIVVQRMTGVTWRSAMVAALFALHPLHVESVAWVTERKDTLSAFFFLLTLLAYERYVHSRGEVQHSTFKVQSRPDRPQSGVQNPQSIHHSPFTIHSLRWFVLSVLFFALGLMSKSMLVTTPFVLLLLDFWPLARFQSFEINRDSESRSPGLENPKSKIQNLIVEKLPFFALSLASCIITVVGMGRGQNLVSAPWSLRIENALVSYARYIGKFFLPVHLVPVYPMPAYWALWKVAGAALLLVLISVVVLMRTRSQGYLLFGWFMFLGTLTPVIGLVAMSRESMADRYTYIPSIGLFVAVVWAVADLANSFHAIRISQISTNKQVKSSLFSPLPPVRSRVSVFILIPLSFCILGACARLSYVQIGHWRDTLTLWNYCLRVDPNIAVARYNLGHYLMEQGRVDEAIKQFEKTLEIRPGDSGAENNLGVAFAGKGRWDEALVHFQRAVGLEPDSADFHNSLALVLLQKGKADEAGVQFQRTLEIRPVDPVAHSYLGHILFRKGRSREAILHYEAALVTQPQSPFTLNNLAWVLATSQDSALRDAPRAVSLAEQAVQLSGGTDALILETLAAAYAEVGRYDDAVKTAQLGLDLAKRQHNASLSASLQAQMSQYKAGSKMNR